MAYFANIFISCLSNSEAFQCYGNFIIKSELLRSFYSYSPSSINSYFQVIEYFMKKKVPTILQKFQELGVYSHNLLIEYICTFFANCAPVEFIRYYYYSKAG